MQPHEMLAKQLEKWIELTSYHAEDISDKKEEDITKSDIIEIAQKIEDVKNVLLGKSKITGWRH
jgi:hypothetical protein